MHLFNLLWICYLQQIHNIPTTILQQIEQLELELN